MATLQLVLTAQGGLGRRVVEVDQMVDRDAATSLTHAPVEAWLGAPQRVANAGARFVGPCFVLMLVASSASVMHAAKLAKLGPHRGRQC